MTVPTRAKRNGKIFTLFVCAFLIAVFAMTSWRASLDKSATIDEPGHLVSAWIQTHFGDFSFECENPPLWKYYIAIGMGNDQLKIDHPSALWNSLMVNADLVGPTAAEALYHTPGIDPDTLLRSARAKMMAFGILLGIAIAWWAWRLDGAIAAIVATGVFCFDPNFLANTPLVKNDVPLALMLMLLMASIWLLGQRATPLRCLFVCVALSSAIMVKFSGILGIPILAIALLVRSLLGEPWIIGQWTVATRSRKLFFSAAIMLGSLLFIWGFTWACYGFRFAPSPDSSREFDFPAMLQKYARHEAVVQSPDSFHITRQASDEFVRRWQPPAGVRLILFASAHHLLPQSFLTGILRFRAVSLGRLAYLCGQNSVTGWWYYFPLAMLFKTPLATLIGLGAAAGLSIVRFGKFPAWNQWTLVSVALLPCVYMLTVMSSNVDVGLRHILPVYPFLFIFLGAAASSVWKSRRRGPMIVILLAVGLVAETLSPYPNFIPFFNIAVGGSRGGLKLLSDTNIDWGQDLPALSDWQAQHPDRPIYLLYWGSADPRYYGIHYINLPQSTAPPDETVPGPGQPVYAISADVLTNPLVRESDKTLFDAIDRQKPIAVLDGSIYIYDAR